MWNRDHIGKPTVSGLYAACGFEPDDFFHTLEVQTHPDRLRVYIGTDATYRARRAEWLGVEAAVIGRLLCLGQITPHEFAAWAVENKPTTCDHDFDVAAWFRKVPDARPVRPAFTDATPPALRATGARL